MMVIFSTEESLATLSEIFCMASVICATEDLPARKSFHTTRCSVLTP